MPVIIIVLHNYLWASFLSSKIFRQIFDELILKNNEYDHLVLIISIRIINQSI